MALNGQGIITMATPELLPTGSAIASAGRYLTEISAKFDPKFLALVSEHLYPSANKAFEELITNCWDADAGNVYVKVPPKLNDANSAIYILDDGRSMDVAGLEQLWNIANSNKREGTPGKRKSIGKFGIGKLATYLLCNELTYVCKFSDGIIRVVTMDYRAIDEVRHKEGENLKLLVRELDEKGLESTLASYKGGDEIFGLIAAGIPDISVVGKYLNEYGGGDGPGLPKLSTWTLAVLSSLKTQGHNIEVGRTKYMVSTALPLGQSMRIKFNDSIILPSKEKVPVRKQWIIGQDLPFDFIEASGTKVLLQKNATPYSHVIIPGIGEVTGCVTLFKDSVARGKSDDLQSSNGCFVNVLGRVVNGSGEGQFSVGQSARGTFNKFRATVRADGLDPLMTIQRDTLTEKPELDIMTAFLLRLFNLARTLDESVESQLFEAASKVRQGSLTKLPFDNVAAVLQANGLQPENLPVFINVPPTTATSDIESWIETTKKGKADALSGFEFVTKEPKDYLATYDVLTKRVSINQNHPFAVEHSGSEKERAIVEDTVLIQIMTDTFLLNNGVDGGLIDNMNAYRDAWQRTMAQIRRKTPAQIIRLLEEWDNQAKPLEEIVGDALSFLGYSVERMGAKGQPEGVATAFASPASESNPQMYRFTYDTKATKHDAVQTGNVHMAGLKRHRNDHSCHFTLLVAPNFQEGALETEATNNDVTPMTTETLCDLIKLSMGYGSLSLVNLKEIFTLRSPKDVAGWVANLGRELTAQKNIDIGTLVNVLNLIAAHESYDVLTCSVIARKYRELVGSPTDPKESQIMAVLESFALIAPGSIGIDSLTGKVFIYTDPEQLRHEIANQAQMIPGKYVVGALASAEEMGKPH